MRRIVTYDVSTDADNDYSDFYAYLTRHSHMKLTESTYEISSDLGLDAFADEIRRLFKAGDTVYIISVAKDNTLLYKQVR